MKKEWQEATEGGDCEKVSLLLEKGEDINSLDRYGQTALINATYRGDTDLVKLLVECGAKLDLTAKLNLTALMLAVINEHNEIVRILVQAGASTDLKGSKGGFDRTPIEYARERGNDEIVNILSSHPLTISDTKHSDSFSMQSCPHCSIEICVRKLQHQGLFKNFRICPNCGGKFTVDMDTKYRQAAFIVIAVISLVFTILLYYQDSKWLIPALVSYIILGLLIYWGNKKVLFVPYQ